MNSKDFKQNIFSLSERLFPMVSRILGNHANTEDAIQEIMMKLWVKRKKIENHPNISGFVFLTARNYCFDILKKKRLQMDEYSIDFKVTTAENVQQQLEWKELNILVKEMLKKLPEQQGTILMMRDMDGYEFHEIATITKLKVEHIRVLLSRARKQLKIALQETYSHAR
jgi:RNA polymerase sigma-70 factor (ECF subfamily)